MARTPETNKGEIGFSKGAIQALLVAAAFAKRSGHEVVDTEAVFAGLLERPDSATLAGMAHKLIGLPGSLPPASPQVKLALSFARELAATRGSGQVAPVDVLLGLFQADPSFIQRYTASCPEVDQAVEAAGALLGAVLPHEGLTEQHRYALLARFLTGGSELLAKAPKRPPHLAQRKLSTPTNSK